jgi:hypothetical protein
VVVIQDQIHQVELGRTIQDHKVRLGVVVDTFQDHQHHHVVAVLQEVVVDILVEEDKFW